MSAWPTRRCGSARRRRRESYLKAELIIDACKATGAEAVHPGYGFLSERTSFAKALDKAGIAFIGPPPKAIAAMGDKIESKKLAQKAGRQRRPRLSRRHRDDRRGGEDREGHRLSGDDEGLGRRRRQGHAARLVREGRARGLRSDQARGPRQLRRRPRLHREVHRAAAPHRDPGARRPARQHPLPRRARMLDPAPPPEGGRGSAVALRHARNAQGDGRAGRRAGAGGRILFRGHGRADRLRRRYDRQELLLPRDEHPAAGRASGDRGSHRPRPRRADDPRRGGREAEVHPGRREAQRLGGREPRLCRGSLSRLPAVDRAADPLPPAGREARRHRRAASTTACSKAAKCRCSTTR